MASKNSAYYMKFCILPILVILLMGVVSAESTPSNVPYSFWDTIKHYIGIGQFSIVGTSQIYCSKTPAEPSWVFINKGQMFKSAADSGCAHGLFDVWMSGWTPYMEYKDVLNLYCNSPPCNVELYCCEHSEPISDADCMDWIGDFSRRKTASCVTWINGGYKCTTNSGTETDIPYANPGFSYCLSNDGIRCYYYSGSGTTCTGYDYPGLTSCPASYQGATLYSSLSTCNANICVDTTWTPATNTVCSGTSFTQTSNCGKTRLATGTKDCGVCTNGATQACTITNGIGSKTCSSGAWGTCTATSCNSGYTLSGGACIATPTPTEVSDIRVTSETMPVQNAGYFGKSDTFKLTLKNFGNKEGTINVEAGYYSKDYCTNVAKLCSSGFSIFSVVNPIPNCNAGENFVSTKQVTLAPGETTDVTFTIDPKTALVTYPNTGEYDLSSSSQSLVAFWGLYQKCLGGYTNDAGTTGKGVMFDYEDFSLNCGSIIGDYDIYCAGVKIGTCKFPTTLTLTDTCSITSTADIILKNATAGVNATKGLSDLKKLSLTENEISTSTNDALFASSCLYSLECLPKENYTVSCKTIKSLRTDGTLTDTQKTSFFSKTDSIINDALNGATLGGLGGVLLCAGSVATLVIPGIQALSPAAIAFACGTAPIAFATGGAILGGGIGNLIASHPSDPLIKKLQAHDENSVGICTAEPTGGATAFIQSLAFINLTGNKTYDGLIMLVIIILFVAIILGQVMK